MTSTATGKYIDSDSRSHRQQLGSNYRRHRKICGVSASKLKGLENASSSSIVCGGDGGGGNGGGGGVGDGDGYGIGGDRGNNLGDSGNILGDRGNNLGESSSWRRKSSLKTTGKDISANSLLVPGSAHRAKKGEI